jgi:hypothetical protein
MSADVSGEILARLRAAVEAGDPERLGIDFWDRGGPPGPGHVSDVLIVRPEIEVLLRSRFDRAYEPPFRLEEYTAPPDLEARKALAALALAAFERTFPEEKPVPMGGATKISIKVYAAPPKDEPVTAPPPEIMKTFWLKVPDVLAPLEELARGRMAALQAGTPNILSTPAPP